MNVIAKFSDLFPLCAVGDIGDFDALSLQLIADAVGLLSLIHISEPTRP